MGQISYRTIIRDSIQHFNAIQDVLNTKGAKYNGSVIDLTTAQNATLVPTVALSSIINTQLQLKAAGTYTVEGVIADGAVDVSDKQYIAVRAASLPAMTGEFKETERLYTVTASAPLSQATSGWYASGTDARTLDIPEATFAVSGNLITVATPGYVSTSTTIGGESGGIKEGSVSSSAAVETTTIESTDVILTTNSSGFALTPYATASSSMAFNPGYIATKGDELPSEKTSKQTYYLNRASISQITTDTVEFTPVLSNKNTITEGSQLSGNVKLAGTSADSIVTDKGTYSGYYLDLATSGVESTATGVAQVTEGYVANGGLTTDVDANVKVHDTHYYVKIASGSVDSKANQTFDLTDGSASVNGSTLTATLTEQSKNVELQTVEGYISEGNVTSTTAVKVKGSYSVDLKTLDANLIPSNIKDGITIFGVRGTLKAGDIIGDIENDALAQHILSGYSAFNENGEKIDGSMNDFAGKPLSVGTKSYMDGIITLTPSSTGYVDEETSLAVNVFEFKHSKITHTITDDNYADGREITNHIGDVSITPLSEAGFSGSTISASHTLTQSAISGCTNIKDYVEVNPSTVSGYILQCNVSGSAHGTVSTSGWAVAGTSTGTVSVSDQVNIKINELTPSSTYLTTTSTGFKAIDRTAPGFTNKDYYVVAGSLGEASTSASITNVTTSPTASGGSAKLDANASSYVVVKASSSAVVNAVETSGWITARAGSSISSSNDAVAKIAAKVAPTVSANNIAISKTDEINGTTTYDDITGVIVSASEKSATVSINEGNTKQEASLKDNYIVGEVTISSSATGSVTVSLDENATGSAVDSYVEALLKRMLGKSYTLPEE